MSFLRARPGAIAAAAAALPLGYYFLRSAPVGGMTHEARPAEASFQTPESRGASAPARQTDPEAQKSERSDILGSEQSVGNFREVDPNASVKRGRKHDNQGQLLNDQDVSNSTTGQWRSAGAKHSVDIAQDPSKSKKSTGEPETARAQGTIIPGGGKRQ